MQEFSLFLNGRLRIQNLGRILSREAFAVRWWVSSLPHILPLVVQEENKVHPFVDSNSSRGCVADRPRLGEGRARYLPFWQLLAWLGGAFHGMRDKENTGFSDSNRFYSCGMFDQLSDFCVSTGILIDYVLRILYVLVNQ